MVLESQSPHVLIAFGFQRPSATQTTVACQGVCVCVPVTVSLLESHQSLGLCPSDHD